MPAFFHMRVKVVTRSKGRSSVAAAAYQSGEKLHDKRQERTFDYSRKHCAHNEILTPAQAPDWMKDRKTLWNTVEAQEKRKDSQTARLVDFALPRSLNSEQQLDLVRGYFQQNHVYQGMVVDFAIHDEGKGNPHVHALMTMRKIEGEGFGNKERFWNDRRIYADWREQWTEHCNAALEAAGSDERIDHRSYKEQGIKKKPGIHEGPTVAALERKGVKTEVGKKNRKIKEYNIFAGHIKVSRERDLDTEKPAERGRTITRGIER